MLYSTFGFTDQIAKEVRRSGGESGEDRREERASTKESVGKGESLRTHNTPPEPAVRKSTVE